ncbi:SCP2 sterol-binding domain-containing protein [Bacterioplanoides sp.]|uniref:SCP2 sterol-binding domain-containing protein n=1 Tax=Bacterioplanoides sp. TaxID=2066072 RepID=UPI003AFF99FA
MSIDAYIEKIIPAVDKFGGFAQPVKFNIGGAIIHIIGKDVTTEDKDADCTITMSPEIFEQILAGDTDPMSAVMEGDIEVEGDSAIAISIQGLF